METAASSREQACEGLAELIRRYGAELRDDLLRLRGLLSDTCPACRQENIVLVNAVREKLVDQLWRLHAQVALDVLKLRLAREFHEATATDERLALWGIETWAYALGLTGDPPCSPDGPSERTATTSHETVQTVAEDGVDAAPARPSLRRCPACSGTASGSAKSCPHCGASFAPPETAHQLLERGEKALAQAWAATQGETSLRLNHEAYELAKQLRRKFGDSEKHRQFHQQAFHALTGKLRELIRQAREQGQLGKEAELLQRLLELNPNSSESRQDLRKITRLRSERLARAEQEWSECKPHQAVTLMQRLYEVFPHDEEIAARLQKMQAVAARVEQATQVEIPECKQNRTFRRMKEVVSELERLQAPIVNLARFRQRVDEHLQRIEPLLTAAKEALTQRQFEQATDLCQQIRTSVADDVEAESIRAAAEQALNSLQLQAEAFDAALAAQEWDEAVELLHVLDPADGRRQPYFDQYSRLSAKATQARVYWHTVLIVVVGAGLWLFAGKTAEVASRGLGELLSNVGTGETGTEEPSGQWAALFKVALTKLHLVLPYLLQGLIASFLLGFFAAALVGWKAVKSIPLMCGVLLVGGALLVMAVTLLGQSESDLGQFVIMILYGAMVGMAVGVLRSEFSADDEMVIVSSACGGLAGAAAFVGIVWAHQHLQSEALLETTLAGGLFTGLVAALGLTPRITCFVLIPIAIGLSFALTAGMSDGAWGEWHFLLPALLIPAAMLPFLGGSKAISNVIALFLLGGVAVWAFEGINESHALRNELLLFCWIGVWAMPGLRKPLDCHTSLVSTLRLALLAPSITAWGEEHQAAQSRANRVVSLPSHPPSQPGTNPW